MCTYIQQYFMSVNGIRYLQCFILSKQPATTHDFASTYLTRQATTSAQETHLFKYRNIYLFVCKPNHETQKFHLIKCILDVRKRIAEKISGPETVRAIHTPGHYFQNLGYEPMFSGNMPSIPGMIFGGDIS